MKLWTVGFALLAVGIGIPVMYGLYEFVLASIPWYWRLSVLLIVVGFLVLLVSAIRDRIRQVTPEQKV
jgi:membrane protein implicated in regulation of membrane protease activity